MPFAPHILDIGTPQVEPTGAPTNDYEHIQATPSEFGGLIGQSEEKLGRGFEQAGSDVTEALIQRQGLQNDVHASELNSWAADQYTDKFSKFSQLSGRDAVDALPQFKSDIQDVQKQALAQAPSLQEKARLSQSLRYLTDAYYRYATNHSDQQFQVYQKTTANNGISNYGNQAGIAYLNGDMQGFQRNLNNQDNEVRNFVEAQGTHDPDLINAAVVQQRGKTLRFIIESKADTDPNAASELFQKYADQMDPASRLAVMNKLRPMLQQQNFRIGADIATGKQPGPGPFQGAEKGAGVPTGYISRVIHIESGGNPNARTGSNVGLVQGDAAWNAKYGVTDPGSVSQASSALVREAADNRPALANVLGRNPTAAELYLAHQQGLAGATALFANPDKPAWETIRRFYKSDGIAKQAIWGNMTPQMKAQFQGGVDQVTAGDFAKLWGAKYNMQSESSVVIDKEAAFKRADTLFGGNPTMLQGVKSVISRDWSNQQVEFSQRRGEIEAQVPSTIESVRNGDLTQALPDDVDLLGNMQAARIRQEYASAYSEGQARRAMQFASPAEVNDLAAGLMQGAGSSEFRQQDARAFDAAVAARQRLLVGKNADPALYAAQSPQVASKFKAIDPKNPKSFADYAVSSLALQEHMGVPDNAQHVLSRDAAGRMANAVMTAPDAKTALDSLQQQTGSAWPKVFRDLVQFGNLPTAYQGIAFLASDPQGGRDASLLSRWLREGEEGAQPGKQKSGIEKAQESLGAKPVADIATAIRSDPSLAPLKRSLMDSGMSRPGADGIMNSVEQLAFAKAYYDGEAPGQAASDAAQSFTRNYEFMPSGSARVPVAHYPTVAANAQSVLDGLKPDHVMLPQAFRQGPSDQRHGIREGEDYIAQVQANPYWLTSPDGNALWLRDWQGGIVMGRNGEPVEVPFGAPLMPGAMQPGMGAYGILGTQPAGAL